MLAHVYTVACALLSLSTAFAAPVETRQTPAEFYLQTSIIDSSNDTGTNKSGLYVYAYHTGAGLNDVALSPNISIASKGFLNASNWQVDLNTPEIPWNLVLEDIPYASWNPVEINAGPPSTGFFLNGTQLQGPPEDLGWGGWLACDWWHEQPQLFWINVYYNVTTFPASCSSVTLKAVPV